MPNEQEAALKALEDQFKKILEQPDVVIPAEEIDGELTDAQRATLQTVLESEMPTPEEFEEDARIMEHNQKVHWIRQANLARRRARREKREKNKKHRR